MVANLACDRPETSRAKARRPLAVDLFAGAGGFALGFEQAGFDVVAAIEYDPIHAAAHAFNFPHTEVVCADASSLESEDLAAAVRAGASAHGHDRADVDVVFGGPPCQGFSAGGKRLPSDERNLLLFDFFRLAVSLGPRYVVLENVPPLKNFPDFDHPGQKLLDRLMTAFSAENYHALTPRIVNASRFGVPQDRRRLIVIWVLEGEPAIDYPPFSVRPVPKRPTDKPRPWERGGIEDDGGRADGPTVWDAIGDLPDLDDFEELRAGDEVELGEDRVEQMETAASAYARYLTGLVSDPADLSYRRESNRRVLTSSRRTSHGAATVKRFAQTEPGHSEPTSRFYRLDRDGLCSTLRAGTGYERGSFMAPRPIHPVEDRVISVREAARLHSFPDWFRFHYSKWQGFRQIGNSLPPLLGRAIGAALIKEMDIGEVVRPKGKLKLGDPGLLKMGTYEAAEYFGANLETAPTHKLRHRIKGKPEGGLGEGQELAAWLSDFS
jgi:DNA (cytosine-5)-methyltransferase 1